MGFFFDLLKNKLKRGLEKRMQQLPPLGDVQSSLLCHNEISLIYNRAHPHTRRRFRIQRVSVPCEENALPSPLDSFILVELSAGPRQGGRFSSAI